jgi:hypothetical protein
MKQSPITRGDCFATCARTPALADGARDDMQTASLPALRKSRRSFVGVHVRAVAVPNAGRIGRVAAVPRGASQGEL